MLYCFEGEAAPVPGTGEQPDAAPAPAPAPKWYEALPEDLRTNPNIAKFQAGDLADLARAHVNQAKLIGVPADKLVQVPDLADSEAVREAMRAFGVPEQANDASYQLQPTLSAEGQPLGDDYSEKSPLAEIFRQSCFKNSVPPAMMQGVFNDVNAFLAKATGDAYAETTRRDKAAEDALRVELGEEGFSQMVNGASFVAEELGITDVLNEAGLGINPTVLKALHKISPMFAEMTTIGRLPASAGGSLTKEMAKAKALELQNEAIRLKHGDPRRKQLNLKAQEFWAQAV